METGGPKTVVQVNRREQVSWKVWLHMEGVTLLFLLISPKLLSTPSLYVIFKTTLKKLQKETSIEAHILMLVPLLLVIFLRHDGWWNHVLGLGLSLGLGFCWVMWPKNTWRWPRLLYLKGHLNKQIKTSSIEEMDKAQSIWSYSY